MQSYAKQYKSNAKVVGTLNNEKEPCHILNKFRGCDEVNKIYVTCILLSCYWPALYTQDPYNTDFYAWRVYVWTEFGTFVHSMLWLFYLVLIAVFGVMIWSSVIFLCLVLNFGWIFLFRLMWHVEMYKYSYLMVVFIIYDIWLYM